MEDRDPLARDPAASRAGPLGRKSKGKSAAPLASAPKTLETVPLKVLDWTRLNRSSGPSASEFV